MVSVSRILSGRFRRSLRDTLFLFLSEHRLWFMHPESGCTEFHDNSPLTVTTVMERLDACRREHTFSRLAVLPEFPWIWTRFEQVIPLKRDELLAYVQGRLQFVPNLNNRDSAPGSADVSSAFSTEELGAWQPVDPAYPTVKVGAVFLRQNRGDRIGLFTAVMSPKSMELDRSCKLRFGKNVAWVPLLAVCLPRLSTADRETILFKTLEHWHFLEWNGEHLRRLLELPALEEDVLRNLIPDLLPRTTDARRILMVQPDHAERPANATPSPDPGSADVSSAFSTSPRIHSGGKQQRMHTLSLENLVLDWKPPARIPEQGFAWIQPSRNRGSKLLWILLCLGVLITGAMVWFYQQAKIREQGLRDEIRKVEAQLSEQFQIHSRATQLESGKKQAAEMETFLLETRGKHAFLLRQFHLLLSTIQEAWVEKIRFSAEGVEMTLLTLTPAAIPVMMQRLRDLPNLSAPELRSRKKVTLHGREVIQLTFSADFQ